nr:hypothetical protein CFP56_38442 [Quercus suber]
MGPGHSHYLQALELSREIAKLLNCTSWSGVGPGLMHAATKGALQVGKPAGGLKIGAIVAAAATIAITIVVLSYLCKVPSVGAF